MLTIWSKFCIFHWFALCEKKLDRNFPKRNGTLEIHTQFTNTVTTKRHLGQSKWPLFRFKSHRGILYTYSDLTHIFVSLVLFPTNIIILTRHCRTMYHYFNLFKKKKKLYWLYTFIFKTLIKEHFVRFYRKKIIFTKSLLYFLFLFFF